MNAQPAKEPAKEPSSNIPVEPRTNEVGLFQESLEEILEGPRKRALIFQERIAEEFPTGGKDTPKDDRIEKTARSTHAQLNEYEKHWLKRHLSSITEEYYSLIASSPEARPQQSELSFHTINQFIMPQWSRVLVSPKSPRMDAFDLETAQIQLAIESASILTAQNNVEHDDVYRNELTDIDGMIALLHLSIDVAIHNQPDIIAVPHPKHADAPQQPDFLVFTSTYDGSLIKIAVNKQEILDSAKQPGAIAVSILKNIRINTVSRRPEFQDKASFHKLLLARESVRAFEPSTTDDAITKDVSREKIGHWLLDHPEDSQE